MKIKRADVEGVVHLLGAKDSTYQINTSSSDVKLTWASLLRLDVARSNDRLRTIYSSLTLKGIGVLTTPVDV